MPEPLVSITVDPRDIARVKKRLDKWQGAPLAARLTRAIQGGLALLVRPLRAAAPRKTGLLQRKIRTSSLRKRFGEVAAYKVGSTAPHAHLVIQGTREHSLAGRAGKGPYSVFPDNEVRRNAYLIHPGARANPFVDEVRAAHEAQVFAFINEQVRRLDG